MPTADFRISNQMLVQNSLAHLQSNLSKLSRSAGPGVDAEAAAQAVGRAGRHRLVDGAARRLNRNDQFSTNIDDATAGSARPTTRSPRSVTQLQRVHDLVIQARNASTDADRPGRDRDRDRLDPPASSASPTRSTRAARVRRHRIGRCRVRADGNYVGASAAVERTIAPGQRVQVNVNGDAVFGPPGNDLFTTLAQISDAVRADPTQLNTLGAKLDTQTQTIQTELAEVGARFTRVDTMKSQNTTNA